jgi:UDP-glucose 4-epimerase
LPLGVPQNLVPFITQTAIGIRERLSVFGDQYPTPDGTCIRDYIHVVDLAEAHLAALERILGGSMNQSYEVFNVGTGQGNSVLEVVHAFEAATGVKLNYAIAPKRPGDVIAAYADTQKVEQVLGWKARYTLEESLASSWAWEQNIRKK